MTFYKFHYKTQKNLELELLQQKLECENYIQDGECVENCSLGYKQDQQNKICQKCQVNFCENCNTEIDKCDLCLKNYFYCPSSNQCFENCQNCFYGSARNYEKRICYNCPQGYYMEQRDQECKKCQIEGCKSCQAGQLCTLCEKGYLLLQGKFSCYQGENCPLGYYQLENQNICYKCLQGCKKCSSPTKCTECEKGYVYQEYICKQNCSNQYYYDKDMDQCLKCIEPCLQCIDYDKCSKCFDHYYMDEINMCHECHESCENCETSGKNGCKTCKKGYLYNKDKKQCILIEEDGDGEDKQNIDNKQKEMEKIILIVVSAVSILLIIIISILIAIFIKFKKREQKNKNSYDLNEQKTKIKEQLILNEEIPFYKELFATYQEENINFPTNINNEQLQYSNSKQMNIAKNKNSNKFTLQGIFPNQFIQNTEEIKQIKLLMQNVKYVTPEYLLNRFQRIKKLGEGSFAVVEHCYDREENFSIAIKHFKKTNNVELIKSCLIEAHILQKLQIKSKNVVKLKEIYIIEENNQINNDKPIINNDDNSSNGSSSNIKEYNDEQLGYIQKIQQQQYQKKQNILNYDFIKQQNQQIEDTSLCQQSYQKYDSTFESVTKNYYFNINDNNQQQNNTIEIQKLKLMSEVDSPQQNTLNISHKLQKNEDIVQNQDDDNNEINENKTITSLIYNTKQNRNSFQKSNLISNSNSQSLLNIDQQNDLTYKSKDNYKKNKDIKFLNKSIGKNGKLNTGIQEPTIDFSSNNNLTVDQFLQNSDGSARNSNNFNNLNQQQQNIKDDNNIINYAAQKKEKKNELHFLEEIKDKSIILILELAEGTLCDEIYKRKNNKQKFTEKEIIKIFYNIINIIKIMHYEFSIYHRDIKPSNILYIDGIYKLADFGSSKIAEQINSLTNNYSLKGTLNYIAPEEKQNYIFYLQRGQQLPINPRQAELFSIGLTLYEVITLQQVKDLNTQKELLKKSIDENFQVQNHNAPEFIIEEVKNMLQWIPRDRKINFQKLEKVYEQNNYHKIFE
ncbi:Protein kinase-like domain [Pseudocohnilembus persalinus]|uniref:Protein kinase-like domain n=1 Tax=Pseudocohnilembus persalinus TaxID=266149 RepID=A0A0V0QRK6_PSEPJ|nr:Protein kinase-like domain [Pseudocohnilembus persalinus]|eukprot:KRX04656.1 Protein kinase-like domain [Pseudocohnilembus persalinus]